MGEDKALIDKYFQDLALHGLKQNVEESLRPDQWLVFERYEVVSDEQGNRYVQALPNTKGAPNKYWRKHPLSRTSASLFLRFAGWPKETGMDKVLDTERNAEAAKAWAEEFGVLGLNPIEPFIVIVDIVNSRRVTADYLGMPSPGDEARGRRNYAGGGPPEESVANFAFEAWEAHIAWRLYESVRKDAVDADSIIHYMSPIDQWDADISSGQSWIEHDIYSRDLETTRQWALTVVTDAVNRKIENHCYPILRGEPRSYTQSWAFKSLLGAMWLQMMFLMREDRRCQWCGKPLDPGMPRHARFCKNNGRCRANWNYNEGGGRSSKESRKQGRYRR